MYIEHGERKSHTFSNKAELAKLKPIPDEDEWVVDARV